MTLLHRVALGAAACSLLAGGATASAASTTALKSSLKGANEVPEKGDPDGRGTATVRIKGTQLCFSLSVSRVGALAAGHIHRGRAGKAGAVVVPLFTGNATRTACVKVAPALAAELKKTPGAFYFNVHTATFPAGALRGQLTRG